MSRALAKGKSPLAMALAPLLTLSAMVVPAAPAHAQYVRVSSESCDVGWIYTTCTTTTCYVYPSGTQICQVIRRHYINVMNRQTGSEEVVAEYQN